MTEISAGVFKKVIISPLGELTTDTRALGDKIRYRIYYDNATQPSSSFVITDTLDKNLSHIKISSGGHYNKETNVATWEINRPMLPTNRRGFVEVEAEIGSGKSIVNKAFIKDLEKPQRETNTVETTVSKPPVIGWIPFEKDAEPGALPRVYMKDETTMGTTVRFDFPGVFVYDERVDGINYQHFSIPGWAASTDLGKPELPVVGEAIEVPFGVNFKPEVIKEETMVMEGYNIYPAQRSPIAQSSNLKLFILDAATYLKKVNYPSNLAVAAHGDIEVIRGHRILFLKINPIQYNPVTRRLRLIP